MFYIYVITLTTHLEFMLHALGCKSKYLLFNLSDCYLDRFENQEVVQTSLSNWTNIVQIVCMKKEGDEIVIVDGNF